MRRSPAAHELPPGFPYAAIEAGNFCMGPAESDELRPRAPLPSSRLRLLASDAAITKPVFARSAAGITTSFHASLPKRLCASARPRTVPGTPGARYPEFVRLM